MQIEQSFALFFIKEGSMKKLFILSATALLFFSCSNLQNNLPTSGRTPIATTNNPVLPQNNFYLTDSGINYLSDLVKKDLNSKDVRRYSPSQISGVLEVYIGETLNISALQGNRLKIVSAPVKGGFNFSLMNNNLEFSSPYQGIYTAELYNDFTYIGTIRIKNKLKYDFTEKDNYDIILNSYKNQNLDLLEKSSQLYLMAFPTNNKQKDVSFMVLDLGAGSGNNLLLNNKIKYLKDNFSLTESEKIKLLLLEEKVNQNNFVVDNYYLNYNKSNLKLNTEIKRAIERKNTATDEELAFLEKFYSDIEDSQLAATLGSFYLKNGEINKGNYYSSLAKESGVILPNISDSTSNLPLDENNTLDNLTTVDSIQKPTTLPTSDFSKNLNNGKDALGRKSYNEAIIFFNKAQASSKENTLSEVLFYRGKTYFLMGNYDKAITDFSNIKEENENSSELYYYLGVINHKQGNIDKAREYLRKSRENNPSSTWGRKSSIYLLKL